jgi:hypothetical protein
MNELKINLTPEEVAEKIDKLTQENEFLKRELIRITTINDGIKEAIITILKKGDGYYDRRYL